MKKNIILPAVIVLAIITCTIFISDGLIYLVASLMALVIMGTIQRNRSRVMKITRWGKANPHKAQALITMLQTALMALGIIAGYNFKKLGYELSDTTAFVFSTIIVTGFLSVHFLPKRSTIAIPSEVNKHRLAFMGIALSSFVMMVLFGNRIEDKYPNSPITYAVKAIDQAIFPDNSNLYADPNDFASDPVDSENYGLALNDKSSAMAVFASYSVYDKETINPPAYSKKETRAKLKAEKKANRLEKKKARMLNRLEKYRLAFAGGLSVGAVLLIILLIGTLCGGICLIIGGFGGSAALIPLGAIVAGGSIWGLIKIFKGSKRNNIKEP
jgi:hypothetical protein